MPLFRTGEIFRTCGIDYAVEQDANYLNELISCVEKYLTGNWGDLCDDDKQANEDALKYGERILGAYKTSQGKIYIITERDRSATTILFASEY